MVPGMQVLLWRAAGLLEHFLLMPMQELRPREVVLALRQDDPGTVKAQQHLA